MASKTDETKVSVPQETTPKKAKTTAVPTYTVGEFASAPKTLDVENPDIIIAAFKTVGKEYATVEEAKEIVAKFKKKEVR